jgi:beta-phosphoglucomutase family hydrolase
MNGRDRSVAPGLGLPEGIRACLFDLDGVLTRTLLVHRRAWKQTFDPLLARAGQPPFSDADYLEQVDGKPRSDGVRDLLASRGLHVPEGDPDDPPERETIAGIGNRKNRLVLEVIAEQGVEVYDGSLDYLRAVREAGLGVAVVTASANGERVLEAAGLSELVDVRIDGVVARRDGLRGKPAPDTFLAAAAALGVAPAEAVVFEDAVSGVAAGRAGGFGWVVGVDRGGNAEALERHGADLVITDLSRLRDVR